MGIAKCFHRKERDEIYVVFTDTLKTGDSVLFSLDVDKDNMSVYDLQKYLDVGNKVETSSYSEEHKGIVEICKIKDTKTESTLYVQVYIHGYPNEPFY